MDKKGSTATNKWAWLPAVMPGVARLMAEKRAAFGDAHVNECWKRGVVRQEPGWFFAREGGVAVGVPWDDLASLWADTSRTTQVLLCVREPEVADGAD